MLQNLDFLKRMAEGIARQFGANCEIVIHDLTLGDMDATIVAIENGHVSGRKVGDGPSHVVLEALSSEKAPPDELDYITKTHDGRILKSSTIFIHNELGRVAGVFSINYDLSDLMMAESAIRALTVAGKPNGESAEVIPMNVSDLLDELLEEAVRFIGKPAPSMSKEEKTRAIQYLSGRGAFLIKKSGDKVARFFGISKYTLYNYLDAELDD